MFTDRLEVTLELTIGGTTHEVPGGQVKAIDCELAGYGFSGAVEFVLMDDVEEGGKTDDALLADYVTNDLIEVALSVKALHADPETVASIEPIAVKGIVTRRSVVEHQDPNHADRAILWRTYRIEFADPARVLWGQHFPSELYTEKSFKDVIDAHKGSKITVTYDWEDIAAASPMIFLHLPPGGASFYDLLVWYADGGAGVLDYDYASASYVIRGAKDASGTPAALFGDDVDRVTVTFPEVPRYARNVLSSYTESPATKPIANAAAQDGIRQDYLVRTPIAQRVDDRATLEAKRLVVRGAELDVSFRRWPTITMRPGELIEFVKGNLWSASAYLITDTWRVRRLRLTARARGAGPDVDVQIGDTAHDVELQALFEKKDETWAELPPYTSPSYPGHVEGKVVSDAGEDDELTYQFYTDESTSQDGYKVKVPLWADQIVTAPYDAHQGSGKMYMPLHKGARVVLALDFQSARVAHLIDWREGGRPGQDVQGEQLFFGKKAAAGTIVSHAYDDTKPEFNIARTNDKDKGTIQIKEGALIIEVKEET